MEAVRVGRRSPSGTVDRLDGRISPGAEARFHLVIQRRQDTGPRVRARAHIRARVSVGRRRGIGLAARDSGRRAASPSQEDLQGRGDP